MVFPAVAYPGDRILFWSVVRGRFFFLLVEQLPDSLAPPPDTLCRNGFYRTVLPGGPPSVPFGRVSTSLRRDQFFSPSFLEVPQNSGGLG